MVQRAGVKRIGPGCHGQICAPIPPAPLGCDLGGSKWGEAGQWKEARRGVGSLGSVLGTLELKKGTWMKGSSGPQGMRQRRRQLGGQGGDPREP